MTGEDVTGVVTLDFDRLETGALDINVEVGAASYWSELVAMTNLDKLQQAGLLKDPLLYLEHIPDYYVPDKQGLVDAIKRQQAQENAMQQAMQQMQQPMV